MSKEDVLSSLGKVYTNPNDPISIEDRIKKLKEFDEVLPHSSTFMAIANTVDLRFEFVSKSIIQSTGYSHREIEENGIRFWWSLIHPDDHGKWVQAVDSLMEYTLNEVDIDRRFDLAYSWNYRLRHKEGHYVNLIHNITPLILDENYKPIWVLIHYTVTEIDESLQVMAIAKLLNADKTYDTTFLKKIHNKQMLREISSREKEILRLLILKKTSKEIADHLFISPNTVDTHRRNILKKLKVGSTGELVAMIKSQNAI